MTAAMVEYASKRLKKGMKERAVGFCWQRVRFWREQFGEPDCCPTLDHSRGGLFWGLLYLSCGDGLRGGFLH